LTPDTPIEGGSAALGPAPRPVKVLVVVSCFPPSKGGVEKTSYELAAGLADRGYSVTVATTSRGREPGDYVERMGRLRVVRFAERRFLFDAPIVPRLAMMAFSEDYDILHVHGMTPSITDLSILFAKFRGKPVVLTFHNDPQQSRPGMLARAAAAVYSRIAVPVVSLADAIVSSTQSYAATSPILSHLIGRVIVIPWGINQSRFGNGRSEKAESAKKNLLFVGQLKKYKGVDILLESLAKLRSLDYHVHADIVGNGPHSEVLKQKADTLKLNGSVRFWGSLDDEALREFYHQADVVALPSLDRREAFGLVLLEAFAAGKPVVASNIPGVRDVASMGAGYLAEPNDPHSLADSIMRALVSEASPKRPAATEMSFEATLARYEALIRRVMSTARDG